MKYLVTTACLFLLTLHTRAESVDSIIGSANRAMDDGLWSVATSKLTSASQIKNLTPSQKTEILSLLAEALIRDNEPSRALELLDLPELQPLPTTPFWKAQALAGTGNFKEATSIFLEIATNPQNELFPQAALTAASLQLSLSQPEQALTTLELLNTSDNSTFRATALLRRVEILLDLRRFTDARSLLSSHETFPPDLQPLANLFDASLYLQENEPEKASTIFSDLLSNPEYQSLTQYSLAAIGKADSLAALGQPQAASETLIAFLQQRPESPLLSKMFSRLTEWLPSEIPTSDHPTITALSTWLPNLSPEPSGFLNVTPDSASAAIPSTITQPTDIAILSLYTKAIALRRINNPASKREALQLLNTIRFIAPTHYLAPRSIITIADWSRQDGNIEAARAIYEQLYLNAKSPTIQGEAAFNAASIAFSQNNLDLASSLFAEASNLLPGKNSETALLNSSLCQLSNPQSQPTLIQHTDPEVEKRLNSELELEKALSNPDPATAKNLLDTFLQNHPEHPRSIEARVSIIEAALISSPPDVSLAKAHIETIRSTKTTLPDTLAPRLAIAELRLLSATNQTEQAVLLAKEISTTYPNTPYESEASLIQGKSLFRTGNYNEARLVLEKLAANDPDSQRAQAALLLASRSAALGATAQSREEALALFDKTISIEGPLKSLAILEKARLLIDLNRIPEAITSLDAEYRALPPDDPSHLPTGLLLGEAIYADGDSKPENLTRSLEIYDNLLKNIPQNTSRSLRIQYLRGITLEKIPDPQNPEQTRIGDALSTYFSVLDRPTDPPPPEWEWFERSGFRALALLENAGKWKPAIAIAEKIASFGGPRAEEAATRAKQLRLKHMVWED